MFLAWMLGCPSTTTDSVVQTFDVDVGCYSPAYSGANTGQIGCGLTNTLGDPVLDQRFNEELWIQAQFWGLTPSVYIFDECPGNMNALSFPEGFILFGVQLTYDTIISTGSDLPIAGVLAHEWAHQVQFLYGWMNNGDPTVRRTELEADAFSGYYMGLAKAWAGSEMDSYFQMLESLGDTNFTHPQHHGTPEERRAAGALGMEVALEVAQSGVWKSYAELHAIFGDQRRRATRDLADIPAPPEPPVPRESLYPGAQ